MKLVQVIRIAFFFFVIGTWSYAELVSLILLPLHSAFYFFMLVEYYPDMTLNRAFVTLLFQNFGDAILAHIFLDFDLPAIIGANLAVFFLILILLLCVKRDTLLKVIGTQWSRSMLFGAEGVFKGLGQIRTVNNINNPMGKPLMGVWKFVYSSLVIYVDSKITKQKTHKKFDYKFLLEKAVVGLSLTLVIMLLSRFAYGQYSSVVITSYLMYSFTETSVIAPVKREQSL